MTYILTIYVVGTVFFQVPTEYSSLEKCEYHGNRVMEERMKDFQASGPTTYICLERTKH